MLMIQLHLKKKLTFVLVSVSNAHTTVIQNDIVAFSTVQSAGHNGSCSFFPEFTAVQHYYSDLRPQPMKSDVPTCRQIILPNPCAFMKFYVCIHEIPCIMPVWHYGTIAIK